MTSLGDMKRYLIKRDLIKSNLNNIEAFLKQFSTTDDPKEIKNRIEYMYKIREDFENVNIDIACCDRTADDQDSASHTSATDFSETQKFSNQWNSILAGLQTLLEQNVPITPNTLNSQSALQPAPQFNVRLPVINLPDFSGKYTEWLPFYDAFQSLINNNPSLDDCQKLHYLKSCLKGEAFRAVESLSISSDNYRSAWDTLQKRYKNTRLIIQGHVQAVLSAPEINKCSPESLRTLIDNIVNNLEALKVLKLPVESWDAMLVTVIINKLDYQTRREFENTLDSNPISLTQLIEFLEKKRIVLESLNQNAKQNYRESQTTNRLSTNGRKHSQVHTANAAITNNLSCYFCKKPHPVNKCEDFLKLSITERFNEIKKRNMCTNCFRLNHRSSECKASGCRICHSRHHTLLHVFRTIPEVQATSTPIANCCTSFSKSQVLLSTAIVLVKDASGNFKKCRSILDGGSQVSILSQAMCNLLNVETKRTNLTITGINDTCSNTVKTANIILRSLHHPYETSLECCVLQNVTANLPTESFDKSGLEIPERVNLADPNFNENGPIDLLLGANVFWNLLCVGRIKLSNPNLFLSKTLLGWVVGGTFIENEHNIRAICNLALKTNANEVLSNLLERFWVQEEVDATQNNWSTEEIVCEEHFNNTFRRDQDGRFIVKLPFKQENACLGDSSQMAMRRFISLERKFRKNAEFKETYRKAINELLDKDYLEEITPPEFNGANVFYLPHSGVFKHDTNESKLRIVYDASAKSSNGLSLNDNLMTGPNLQNDSFAILLRFRLHQVIISCDMEKMFLQIKVDEVDTNYQLIYWRFGENEQIKVFRLKRLVFGLTNSPYTAIRCVKQLALEAAEEYPNAARVIELDRFTDDILTGAENIEEGLKLRDQLITILNRGGFKLAKWNSNVQDITRFDQLSNNIEQKICLGSSNKSKVLGLWWDPSKDLLSYCLKLQNDNSTLTKRRILSAIAKIYDPLGLISPIVTKAKLIMQQIWTLKLEWDDPVPSIIQIAWTRFIEELEFLKEITIPRKLVPDTNSNIELIVFCDASLSAYGAIVYLRTKIGPNNFNVNLMTSKSRVSPIKTVSLPRLELCAAVLGAKLMNSVSRELNVKIYKTYLFTDSMIVLHYLNANANTWQVYVANRVSKIQSLSSCSDWYHVESKDNPADLVSRGAYARQINLSLYWNGPKFLKKDQSNWPINKFKPSMEVNALPEKRKVTLTATVARECSLLTKYSSFSKLKRVLGFCIRFIHNLRDNNNRLKGPLSINELAKSHNKIMELIQRREFPDEYQALKNSQPINKASRLYNLDPFIDENGLLRIGGRLRNASLSFDRKFPIVLPAKHHVTKLLINKEHISLLHAGISQTLASLRTQYWPLKAKNEIKKVINSCVTCFRARPILAGQKMGNLPKERITPCRPFLKVGIDYLGPINLKLGGKRSTKMTKAWVALFVCLATKAIHLEIVSDLTSDCFINALKRFTSRRGKISHIYCDNAKTFIGAKRQIDNAFLRFIKESQSNLEVYFLQENITWKFIPPRSPNFGGLWERLVGSVKYHFKRVVVNANLTFEEALTLTSQIEAVVNSRPLTPMSNDPLDLQVLTPAHFLIGENFNELPESTYTDVPETRLSRWERIQRIKQHFWKRWSLEVLSQLQPRPKWCQASPEVHIGTLVLISEDNLPPMMWKIGRIEKVFPGPDGLVRVAAVRTNQGMYTRSIRRLAVLPVNEEQ